jgi:hypothetical protein
MSHTFFLPHAPTFTGGIRVASGDVDRDGNDDITYGFGPGRHPEAGVYQSFNVSPLNGTPRTRFLPAVTTSHRY